MIWFVASVLVWVLGIGSFTLLRRVSRGRATKVIEAVEEQRADDEWEVASWLEWCTCPVDDVEAVPVIRGADTLGGEPYTVAMLCPVCRGKRRMPGKPRTHRGTSTPPGPYQIDDQWVDGAGGVRVWTKDGWVNPDAPPLLQRLEERGAKRGGNANYIEAAPPLPKWNDTGYAAESGVFGLKPKPETPVDRNSNAYLFDLKRFRYGYPRVVPHGEFLWRLPDRPEVLCPVVDGENTHQWSYVVDASDAEPVRSVCTVCDTMRTRRGVPTPRSAP